jgi:hypothetical protein
MRLYQRKYRTPARRDESPVLDEEERFASQLYSIIEERPSPP